MNGCLAINGRDEAPVDHPLDLHPTIAICRGVHRSRLISTVITREINGHDDFT